MKQLGGLQEGKCSRGGYSGRGERSRNVSINKQLESDRHVCLVSIHSPFQPIFGDTSWVNLWWRRIDERISRWRQTLFAAPPARQKLKISAHKGVTCWFDFNPTSQVFELVNLEVIMITKVKKMELLGLHDLFLLSLFVKSNREWHATTADFPNKPRVTSTSH